MNHWIRSRLEPCFALLIVLLSPLVGGHPVAAQTFEVGDLYLLSTALPTVGQGVLEIDPLTGNDTLLVDLPDAPLMRSTLSWDPFRNRLLAASGELIGGFITIDPAGNLAFPLPAEDTPRIVAARGDGIVYFAGPSAPYRYLDAAGTVHDLLDLPGTGAYTSAAQPEEMIYDPDTNSLLLLQGTFAGCPDNNATCAVKVPLTPDGTQVAGAETLVQTSVSTTLEDVVGSGYAPAGEILVVVDTNTNDQEPRMLRLDPSSMVFSTWASNGPYTGAAATSAGTYSLVRDEAVIVDSFSNVLRAFGLGASGPGTLLGSDLGFAFRLVEIHTQAQQPPGPVPAFGMGGLVVLALGLLGAQHLVRHGRRQAEPV